MARRWYSIVRKMAPLAGAGILLQANGCTIDPQALTQGLVTAIANNLIANLVFGVFNIPLTGF